MYSDLHMLYTRVYTNNYKDTLIYLHHILINVPDLIGLPRQDCRSPGPERGVAPSWLDFKAPTTHMWLGRGIRT